MQVLIKTGTYGHGNKERQIASQTFEVSKKFVETEDGAGYVTVVGTKVQGLEDRNCRIKVSGTDCFEYTTTCGELLESEPLSVSINYEAEFTAQESDEDAMERIADTFNILNELTDAASQGIIRGMVISGPPGIGKSYGVGKTLEKANFHLALKDKQVQYEVISGSATPIGLYKKLYMNRAAGFVTVLDDCDTVLYTEESLNLLKAALDSGDKRKLTWLSESAALRREDIPESFEFEGSVIFLTNLDFERTKASKIKVHLDAIQSRCHYLDLEISSKRDQLLRIKQVVRAGMLDNYALNTEEKDDVVQFVYDNVDHLRELSLRVVLKVASLAAANKSGALKKDWRQLAEMTVLTREAKFKRLAGAA